MSAHARYLCCLLAALVPLSGLAAEKKPLATWSLAVWSTRDGLPHNQVNGIAQSVDGYLWFATWEGLVRYNSREFRTLRQREIPVLADTGIRSVHVGQRGSVLLATARGGVSVRRGGQWQTYTSADGLAQNETMAIAEDREGRIWVAHESEGVSRIAPDGAITRFGVAEGLRSGITYAVLVDRSDAVWVGTGEGLLRIEGDRLQAFGVEAGLPAGAVFAIAQRYDGALLVGTEHGVYVGMGGRFASLSADMPDDAIASLQVDPEGDIWAGSVNRGLIRFSAERGIEIIDTSLGLPNNRVPSLFIDSERNVWVGTNAGLVRLADKPFVNYDRQLGLSNDYVRALLQTRAGDILIGSSGGLDRLRDGRIESLDIGLHGDAILSLAEDVDGSLWIGMYSKGLVHWKDGRVLSQSTRIGPVSANQVRAILRDRDGSLWVGVTRGLVHLRGDQVRAYTREDGLPRNFVFSLHQDRRGRIWVGTTNGVAVLDGDRFRTIDIDTGDAPQDVFDIHEDADGTMWFATDRGLVRWRNGKVHALGQAQGLPVVAVFQVITDAYDNFWLSSNAGVLHLHRDAVEAAMGDVAVSASLRYEHFTEVDGMGSAQCNGGSGPAAIRAADGSLWFATARGAASIQPDTLARYGRVPPPVVIETLRVDGAPVDLQRTATFPARIRKLEVEFVSLTFEAPEQVRYRWRLLGFEHDWSEPSTRSSAQYTNLAPGRYEFQVVAGRGARWASVPESLAFTVYPAWYQQIWFRLALLAVAISIVFGLYRLRIGTIRRRELALEQEVRQRTHDLRSKNQELERLNQRILENADALERQARTDNLTGLANRRDMEERLAATFHDAVRRQRPMSVALLDIDHFKSINDRFSHQVGDRALCAVADVLRQQLAQFSRESKDVICHAARWGGEEFAIVFANTTRERALEYAERLRAAIAAIDCGSFAPGLIITASIGVAERSGFNQFERILWRADQCLYVAKRAGRNRVSAEA